MESMKNEKGEIKNPEVLPFALFILPFAGAVLNLQPWAIRFGLVFQAHSTY